MAVLWDILLQCFLMTLQCHTFCGLFCPNKGRTSAISLEQNVDVHAQARNRTGGTTMGMSHFTTKPHAHMPRQNCVCRPAVQFFRLGSYQWIGIWILRSRQDRMGTLYKKERQRRQSTPCTFCQQGTSELTHAVATAIS
jgi:hypothetical protein